MRSTEKLGPIVSAHTLRPEDDVTVITREGMALRTPGNTIRLAGRATQGVRVIRMSKGDGIVGVAVLEGSPNEAEEVEGVESIEPGTNGHEPGEDALALPTDALEVADIEAEIDELEAEENEINEFEGDEDDDAIEFEADFELDDELEENGDEDDEEDEGE
jgi:DNA gyrase subunit A